MKDTLSIPNGLVSLIGAGPGDPGLITAKGLSRLQRADAVVYDALVSAELVDQAPVSAQRICVGKRSGAHAWEQDQINQLLVDLARAGNRVVRLKGGDPYLFGRGAEEAAFLAQHGLRCEVVPGVTAGIAVPATAGIAVTHRKLSSTVTFVTGHEDPTKGQRSIDYTALAALIGAGGTVCFYMGTERLAAISDRLCGCGLSPQTAVAVIQWGTLPRQRSVRTDLASAAADASDAGLGPPAVIVVGSVAAIDPTGLDYFVRRPLFGERVVICRAAEQAPRLRDLLNDLGAQTLVAPSIEISPPRDWSAVDRALRDAGRYDWLVLTSANGVEALAGRLSVLNLDSRCLGGVKVAVIGDATARHLRQRLGIQADLVPQRFVAESLAEALIGDHGVDGKQFLLLRADIARPQLPDLLEEAGGVVTDLTVYRTQRPAALPAAVSEAFDNHAVDWVALTSSSTAVGLAELLGSRRGVLNGVKIASIGPVTSRTLRRLGLEPTVEANPSNTEGLVAAMVAARRRG